MEQPATLLDGLIFPEGPRWHDGRLWFSDMHAHEVVAVDLDGTRETICAVPGQPSGLGWLPDGRLLVVSMVDRRIVRLEADGVLHLHADLALLAPFHCNDMVVDAGGNAYVGNFGYDLHGGGERRSTSLTLVRPDGSAETVAEDLMFPNGTVITPDGGTLVVGESGRRQLTAFSIAPDGRLGDRRPWASLPGPPDGIALDADGCIWVAVPRDGHGVIRLAEGGEVRQQVRLDGMEAFACALGGPTGRTLFICEAPDSDPAVLLRGAPPARITTIEVEVPHAGWP